MAIGIKHPSEPDVELPRAYILMRPVKESETLDEVAVKAYLRARLVKFKELVGGVRFVGDISKNTSGKILKRMLTEIAKEEQDRAKL